MGARGLVFGFKQGLIFFEATLGSPQSKVPANHILSIELSLSINLPKPLQQIAAALRAETRKATKQLKSF